MAGKTIIQDKVSNLEGIIADLVRALMWDHALPGERNEHGEKCIACKILSKPEVVDIINRSGVTRPNDLTEGGRRWWHVTRSGSGRWIYR